MEAVFNRAINAVDVTTKDSNGNEVTVSLSPNDITTLMKITEKEIYFREDVENQLDILIEENDDDIPWKELAENKDFVDKLVSIYADYRNNYGDNATWQECMDEALNKIMVLRGWENYLPDLEDKEL